MNTEIVKETVSNIVKDISEAYEGDEEMIESLTALVEPHIQAMAEKLESSSSGSKGDQGDVQQQVLEILGQLQAQQGTVQVKAPRKASGWTAYAAAMKKEHGWGWREVKENAPWGNLSDEEKAKWDKIAQEKQQVKLAQGGRVASVSVGGTTKKVNPWNVFVKNYRAGLPEGEKFDMAKCKVAYAKFKEEQGTA